MAHWIMWLSIVLLVLAFLFFIASAIVLEFATGVTDNGDLIIPWYYWLFFVLAGVLFLTVAILQIIIPVESKYDVIVEEASFESSVKLPTKQRSELFSLSRF